MNSNELILATYLAKKAFKEKKNIAKDIYTEFLLFLLGTRDIKKVKGKTFKMKEGNLTLPLDWKKIERISLSRIK